MAGPDRVNLNYFQLSQVGHSMQKKKHIVIRPRNSYRTLVEAVFTFETVPANIHDFQQC